ncbi:unnamed protein product, partial [Acanthoscelides obtectus]
SKLLYSTDYITAPTPPWIPDLRWTTRNVVVQTRQHQRAVDYDTALGGCGGR